MPLLSFVQHSLSHDSRPPPDGAGLPRLRERRAFWQVGTTIAQMYNIGKCSLPAGSRLFIPRLKDGGFQAWISVIPPLERVYSQRLCFHGVRLRLQDATMLPEEKVWVDTLMGEILQAGSY